MADWISGGYWRVGAG